MLNHALVGQAMRQARENERLTPQQVAALQDRKLRDLVRFAKEHSPFYGRLYKSLDPDRFELADLPTVTKRLLQENFDDVVTDRRLNLAGVKAFCDQKRPDGPPWHLGEFAVLMSSGTSGERGYFVLDGAALADAIAVGYRQSNRAPAPSASLGAMPTPVVPAGAMPTASVGMPPASPQPPQQRIAAVMLIEPFDAAGMLMRLIPESVGPKRLIDIRQDFETVCRELNEFQPTLLSSFPYLLRMLAEAAGDGRLRIAPARITSSGDVLTASDRSSVRAAFGLEPFDYYCSTEVPYIAWEGDDHDGLHVNADYAIVESVDAAYRPVPSARLGDKLLLTNLSNRAMPLIRYEMSDQVEYLAEGGGGPLPRIRTVAGRVEHVLSLPGVSGGRTSLIPEQIDEYLGGLEGLANYQVIQETKSRLTVNFIPRAAEAAAGVGQALRAGLALCFERYGVSKDIEIDLRQVERLAPVRPGATKICHYWNRSLE